jgi:hypothetical protein
MFVSIASRNKKKSFKKSNLKRVQHFKTKKFIKKASKVIPQEESKSPIPISDVKENVSPNITPTHSLSFVINSSQLRCNLFQLFNSPPSFPLTSLKKGHQTYLKFSLKKGKFFEEFLENEAEVKKLGTVCQELVDAKVEFVIKRLDSDEDV